MIFLIETTENEKFGCYISNKITEQRYYVYDPTAFIFKFNGNEIEKYPIINKECALKIYDDDIDESSYKNEEIS